MDSDEVLAVVRQLPGEHAMHVELLVKVAAPPPAYVPTGHTFAGTVAAPVPAGQK